MVLCNPTDPKNKVPLNLIVGSNCGKASVTSSSNDLSSDRCFSRYIFEIYTSLKDIVCKNQIIFLLFDSDSDQIRCFPDILKETMDKKKGDEHFFLVKIHIWFWANKV